MEPIIIGLTLDQLEVLKLILTLHRDDQPNGYYPYQPFKELCEKVGLQLPEDDDIRANHG